MPTFRGRHLRTSDVVFGLLTASLLSISGSEIATGRWHSPVPVSVLAALLMFGPVTALSRYPVTAAAVSSAALVVESSVFGVPQSLAGFFYLVVLPLALAFYLPRRRWWVGGLVVADAFASTVATMRADGDPPYDLLFTTLISVLAAGAGLVLRDRQRQAREARTETDELRIEQALRVAEAIGEERGRIARDLHDVVAHAVSLMVVQAAAGRAAFATRPESSLSSFDAITSSGQRALEELRRMLGLLTTTGPSDITAGGLAGLPDLVAATTAAGSMCTLSVDADLADIQPGIGLTVYRIVQESLTNAVRHAHGADVTVTLQAQHGELVLCVRDSGAARRAPEITGSGHGLIGMQERAAVYDGTLQAGPTTEGGWLVEAHIPLSVLPAGVLST